jgi:hypothetical protein
VCSCKPRRDKLHRPARVLPRCAPVRQSHAARSRKPERCWDYAGW